MIGPDHQHKWRIQRTIGDRTPFAFCTDQDCEAIIHPWETAWSDAALPMPLRGGGWTGTAPGIPDGPSGQESTVPAVPKDTEPSPETLARVAIEGWIRMGMPGDPVEVLKAAGLWVVYNWQVKPVYRRAFDT